MLDIFELDLQMIHKPRGLDNSVIERMNKDYLS